MFLVFPKYMYGYRFTRVSKFAQTGYDNRPNTNDMTWAWKVLQSQTRVEDAPVKQVCSPAQLKHPHNPNLFWAAMPL